MKKKSVILRADDFKYPSKDERVEVLKGWPVLKPFQFQFKSEFESILLENKSLTEAARISNLYRWNNCLINRFGKLRETFIYLMVSYKRNFSDNNLSNTEVEVVHKFMFDYYAEVFYYFFFSVRDVIGQVLRVYFAMDRDEDRLYIDKEFKKELCNKNQKVYELLDNFLDQTKEASDKRNGFTHRFSPNEEDYRSVLKIGNGEITLAAGTGSFVSSEAIINNIKDSLQSLNKLMNGLNRFIII